MGLTPKQIADGWIAHDGGECPVSADKPVRVLLTWHKGKCVEPSYGRYHISALARDFYWDLDQSKSCAIIAYKPEQSP